MSIFNFLPKALTTFFLIIGHALMLGKEIDKIMKSN